MLGGSSAINALMTTYPSRKVFDVWAQYGNGGWDAEAMEPYLKKWEHFHQPSKQTVDELGLGAYLDDSLSSDTGSVSTSVAEWKLPLSKTWMDTMDGLGLKSKVDPITGEALGAFMSPSFVDPTTATRSHSGTAYWEPASTRPNLHTIFGATVDKIVIEKDDDDSLVAKGVQYLVGGNTHVAHAKRQVILSAGGFGSPALLEMSGIGNPRVLEPLGIDVLVDNVNVGENLQDHTILFVSHEVQNPAESLDSLKLPGRFDEAMKQYIESQSGPLSVGFAPCGTLPATIGMDASEKGRLLQLVEDHTTSTNLSQAEKMRAQYFGDVVRSEAEPMIYISPQPFSARGGHGSEEFFGISIVLSALCPFSKGSTHIQSPDPNTTPLIDPNFLNNELDIEVCARGVLFTTNTLFKTSPFKEVLKPGGKTNIPPTIVGTSGVPETIEEAKAWVVAGSGSLNHVTCTCAMMSRDFGGVVDDQLRVYGVKGLRICDASIFPVIPKGPMTSSIYAVAEKGADLIKEVLMKP
jgi:choline dehydrogenase-like flavoprotein